VVGYGVIDPAGTALILLDMQNDGLSEGGKFYSPELAGHAARQNLVANVSALAAAARAAGMPVIHVHHVEEPGHRDTARNLPLLSDVVERDSHVRGTWGAEAVPGLEPQEGDVVVYKQRMNAFYSTTLETKLRGLETRTLVLTGVFTNFSVEHTSRHAADAGFEVVVVTDGTATFGDDWQSAALDFALSKIARSVAAAELLDDLRRPR
jgi:gluconolactonase